MSSIPSKPTHQRDTVNNIFNDCEDSFNLEKQFRERNDKSKLVTSPVINIPSIIPVENQPLTYLKMINNKIDNLENMFLQYLDIRTQP